MIVDNPNFSALNQLSVKQLYYVVEIAFDDANTDLYYLTSHDSAATPDAGNTLDGCLENISGTTQKINPDKARSTIGDLSFTAVDLGGALTSKIRTKLNNDKGLRNKRVRLYIGGEGLNWGDYVLRTTQRIQGPVSFESAGYQFKCSDIQRALREEIFDRGETELKATIEPGDTEIELKNATKFALIPHGASYSDAPDQYAGYAKIGDDDDFEIVRFTGVTGNTLNNCTRGVFGTTARAWEVSDDSDDAPEVIEFIYLEMPAPKLIYALMTGSLHNQGGATLPDRWHLGMDAADVRLSDFATVGEDLWDPNDDTDGFIVRFEGLEKEDGKKFIEQELYLLSGGYPVVYSNGEIGFKRMTGVLADAPARITLNYDNVVSAGQLEHDFSSLHNQFFISWFYSVRFERYLRTTVLVDGESEATHGAAEPLDLEFRGLTGNRFTDQVITQRFRAMADRYTSPPLRISVECLPSLNTLEVGDIVYLDLAHVRDYTGSSSLQRAFEIQQVKTDWVTGRVTLELFGSSNKQQPQLISGQAVVDDSWYTSEGTDIASLPEASTSGSVTTITSNLTLNGNDDLRDSTAIYYCDNDLVIDSGVTLTITKNIQLRIRGFLTNNGSIDGKGLGTPGGTGISSTDVALLAEGSTYAWYDTPSSALPEIGGYGGYRPQSGAVWYQPSGQSYYNLNTLYHQNIDSNGDLVVDGDGFYDPIGFTADKAAPGEISFQIETGDVSGIPGDLRGCSGSGGGPIISYDGSTYTLEVAGTDGGYGGSGLMIVCRGYGGGTSSSVDLSGTDANTPGSWATGVDGIELQGGTGSPGMPGAAIVVLDGTTTITDFETKLTLDVGAFPVKSTGAVIAPMEGSTSNNTPSILGSRLSDNTLYAPYVTLTDTRAESQALRDGGTSKRNAYHRIVYLSGDTTPAEENQGPADQPLSISVEEKTNTPPSPAGNLSTIEITVTPPSDTSYSHSLIDYRVSGDNGWTEIGPASPEQTVTVSSDGTTYEFRARSVSISGAARSDGPRASITTTDIESGDKDTIDNAIPAPPVSGLEIQGQGNSTEFGGKDVKIQWRKTSVTDWVEIGSEPTNEGAGAGSLDQYFAHYLVNVYHNGVLLRTEEVNDNAYIYSFEKNAEDYERENSSAGAYRNLTVEVQVRGRQNQLSEPRSLDVSNPAPSLPSNLNLNAGFQSARITFDRPSDLDYQGVLIYRGTSSGFARDANSLIYDGPDNDIVDSGLTTGTTYYYRIKPYDAFGKTGLTESSELSTATQQITNPDVDDTPPSTPGNLTLTTGVEDAKLYTKSWVKGTWDASTDDGQVQGYEVQYWTSTDSSKTATVTGDTEHRFFDAVAGATYNYRVRAVDWAGNKSSWTSTESIVAAGDTAAPGLPSGISVSGGFKKLVIRWTNPSSDNYLQTRVYIGTSAGFSADASTLQYEGRGDTFVFDDLEFASDPLAIDYYIKLSAVSASGVESSTTSEIGPKNVLLMRSTNVDTFMESAAITNAFINNLDAQKITTGTLDAGRIGVNSITASKISVTNLSAISADMGTITAGTITGATIRTGSGNPRVEMDSASGIQGINSGGVMTFQLDTDGSGFVGAGASAITWDTNGNVLAPGDLTAGFFESSLITTDDKDGSNLRVELGPRSVGGTTYVMQYWDGTNRYFSIDDAGNVDIAGSLSTSAGTSSKRFEIKASNGDARFYGDRGDGLIDKLATIGITDIGGDFVIGDFGNNNSGQVAIRARSDTAEGIQAISQNSVAVSAFGGPAVRANAFSSSEYALVADGGTPLRVQGLSTLVSPKAHIEFEALSTTTSPTFDPGSPALFVDANNDLYYHTSGGSWTKLN